MGKKYWLHLLKKKKKEQKHKTLVKINRFHLYNHVLETDHEN
jgi:hypothetical protein